MTPEQKQAIQARAEKATPGPWTPERIGLQVYAGPVCDGRRIADIRGWGWLQRLPDGAEQQDANVEFIAAAREDVPALLAHIDQLEQENEETAGWYQEMGAAYAIARDECDAALERVKVLEEALRKVAPYFADHSGEALVVRAALTPKPPEGSETP